MDHTKIGEDKLSGRRSRSTLTGSQDVGRLAYYGLYSLQHRGQESCGIVVNDDGVFSSHKDLGLVGEVFSSETLDRLPQGTMAVGHTRYGTTGASNRSNCQPAFFHSTEVGSREDPGRRSASGET